MDGTEWNRTIQTVWRFLDIFTFLGAVVVKIQVASTSGCIFLQEHPARTLIGKTVMICCVAGDWNVGHSYTGHAVSVWQNIQGQVCRVVIHRQNIFAACYWVVRLCISMIPECFVITLRTKLSGTVYCNQSCLWVCLCVCGSVTTITQNCVHRSSPNWVCR